MAYSAGYNAGGRLLGGLSAKPSVAAFGKGRGMSAQAGLGMEAAKSNQEMAANQQQQDSQQRMQQAGNAVQRAGNESQARIQQGGLANRKATFDLGMAYDQAGRDKKRTLDFRQALFNSLTQDF